MSCDGWDVGDKCQAARVVAVEGTGGRTIEIAAGTYGVVREVNHAAHRIVVEWTPSRVQVPFSHSQIHDYLRRIT